MDPFSITQAQDWQMFKVLMGAVGLVFTGLSTFIGGLLVYIWKDLTKRITESRKDDAEKLEKLSKQIEKQREIDIARYDKVISIIEDQRRTDIDRIDKAVEALQTQVNEHLYERRE
jgi:dethiobiotin synthetase